MLLLFLKSFTFAIILYANITFKTYSHVLNIFNFRKK